MQWVDIDYNHHAYVDDDGKILAEVERPIGLWFWQAIGERWITRQDAKTAVEKKFAQKEPPA